jgi:hypothetical protein
VCRPAAVARPPRRKCALDRGPARAEPSRVGSVSPLYGALLRGALRPPGSTSASGIAAADSGRLARSSARREIDSVGDCPCAVGGCEEGFALTATAGA